MEKFRIPYQTSITEIMINKKWKISNKNIFYKYLITGIINTILGFLVLALLSLTKIETWAIILLTNFLCIIFNYFSYGEFAFKNHKKNMKNYIFVYMFIYFLQLAIITIGNLILRERIYAVVLSIPFYVIANFYLLKKFVYKD